MTIQKKYELACSTPSDINEHLPSLKNCADVCEHVTEMGVRQPTSTYAFLASKAKKIVSYDIETQPEVHECKAICEKEGRNWTFIEADVLKVEIEETDLLWIDTFHTYSQLKNELKLHAKKARKYIAFHDTTTYEKVGEQSYGAVEGTGMNCGRGLWPAITEFLEANKEWKIVFRAYHNNGLTIIGK